MGLKDFVIDENMKRFIDLYGLLQKHLKNI
jgi:hypothetical protein